MHTKSAAAAEMTRAYSTIEFKAVDEEKRIIEGIASTPAPDRMSDVLEPLGAEYKTPLPFLYQHNSRQPIGNVVSVKATKNDIRITVQFAAAGVAPFIDEAWALIKAGLIRGMSVGFRPLEESYDKELGGYRYLRWEMMEVSAVTIPANAEASITNVRFLDHSPRAASGQTRSVVRLDKPSNLPGVSGKPGTKNMTIKEQIAQFEAKRAASEGRMEALETKAADEGRTFEATEKEEHATLKVQVKDIDEHLVILKEREARLAANAKKVDVKDDAKPEQIAAARSGRVIEVKSNAPKGVGMARVAIAMVRAQGNPYLAMELAKTHWKDSPEVELCIKAAVEAGDTTTSGWASQLLPAAQQMSGDFLEMLRDRIIIGRLPLRKVPFNVAVPLQSGAGTYRYVGEGAGKPVTNPTFGNATLRFEKAAGIIVITEELARFGSPDAELLVRDEMLKGLTGFFDGIFVGTTAAVSNVQPAGILNGKSATAASGTTAAFFRANMNTMIQIAITNKQDPSTAYLLMGAGVAMSLSAMVNSLGQPEFGTISASGGNYLGIPIVVSQACGTNIILCFPDQILLAEDPGVRIDVSREATIEMDTTPTAGESSPITTVETIKSMFQNNMIAIRAEQYRTWKVGRTSAVEFISGANYSQST